MRQSTIRTNLQSYARPAGSYGAAMQRLNAFQAQDDGTVSHLCSTTWRSHGEQTERAIVFFHGLTSCPQQFVELSEMFYQQGYNVFLPRMPHHGMANQLSTAQTKLTAPELAGYADEAVDIAQGLGRKVVVMGLSVGGLLAAWAAQYRSDVALAVPVSPFMWPKKLSPSWRTGLPKFGRYLPNWWGWWDEKRKSDMNLPYGYPRYSSRAVAECLRLAQSVLTMARKRKAAAEKVVFMTNANDEVVDNNVTQELIDHWRRASAEHPERIEALEFEARLRLTHDLISPFHPEQKIELVYPTLVQIVTRALAKSAPQNEMLPTESHDS